VNHISLWFKSLSQIWEIVGVKYSREELIGQVNKLGRVQPWNHNYVLAHGIETRPGYQVSHAKNLVKWQRIKPLLESMEMDLKTVLDVGCNEGYFSLQLADMGATVLGIDADQNRIMKARFIQDVLGTPRVRYALMDIYSDEFAEQENFNVCLCMGFLHRVPDPFSAIQRLVAKTDIILFEWKTLKCASHDEPFAYYRPGGYVESDYYGTQYWVMSFACVEAILRRLGYDRFHRVDDPAFGRGILVAGRVDNPIFCLANQIKYRNRVRIFLSHTKRYVKTVGKILSGQINA